MRADRPLRPSLIPATRAWGIVVAFATALTSGVAVFVNGYAVKHFAGSAPFTTAKNLVAALLLIGVVSVASARRSADGWTTPRTTAQRLGLVLVGVVGGSVPFLLFFEGLARASSTDAALIHKTLVVWVGVLAVLFLRERLRWPHVAAIAVILAGQVLLADDVTGLGLGAGEAMVLAATLLWSVEILVAKRLLDSLSPLTVGVSRMAIGVVVLGGWLVATGQIDTLFAYRGTQWLWIGATGLLLTVYVTTWFSALARAQAVDVTAVLVFGAVITATLDAVVDGVSVRPDLIGLVAIAGGTLLIGVGPARRRQESSP